MTYKYNQECKGTSGQKRVTCMMVALNKKYDEIRRLKFRYWWAYHVMERLYKVLLSDVPSEFKLLSGIDVWAFKIDDTKKNKNAHPS